MLRRFFRHLVTDHGSARRAFPAAALARIEAAIAEGERRHRGQVRFAVEAALPLARVLRGSRRASARSRCSARCAIWDTEENCGVLVYLLLADRDVEIVADRGIHAQGRRRGVGGDLPRRWRTAFRAGRFAEGVEAGHRRDQRAARASIFRATGGARRQRAAGPAGDPLALPRSGRRRQRSAAPGFAALRRRRAGPRR